MALDTATKRAAALGAGYPPGVVLPVPDGTIDAADRAALVGSAIPSAAASDTDPDAFGFDTQAGVATSATITSNSITPAGYDTAASISVSGGTYSINGAAFTAVTGTLNPGDSVRVQHTSSASNNTQVTTTLTIGTTVGTFASITVGAGGAGGALISMNRRRRHLYS
jgi:hypothetical protein